MSCAFLGQVLTAAEVQAILDACEHLRDRFLFAVLYDSGLRIEELLELDQFSIQRFKHPTTGEIIPLLHVYPSKSGSERLLATSPELLHVLALIVHRLREPDGTLPLTSRYDTQEKRVMPPAPLLFQRYRGRWNGMSYQYIYGLMDLAGKQAGLTRVDGKPLTFRPHDLRRIFATDAQNSGVPTHVIAALLGHESIETEAIYAAVYDETVIAAHSNFIANRRAMRPPTARTAPDQRGGVGRVPAALRRAQAEPGELRARVGLRVSARARLLNRNDLECLWGCGPLLRLPSVTSDYFRGPGFGRVAIREGCGVGQR